MNSIRRIIRIALSTVMFYLIAGATYVMAAPDLSWLDLSLYKEGVGITDQWNVGDDPVFHGLGTNIGTSTALFGFTWTTSLYDPSGVLVDRDGPFEGQQPWQSGFPGSISTTSGGEHRWSSRCRGSRR